MCYHLWKLNWCVHTKIAKKIAHRVDWWRLMQWPSSNMADAHRFGTESPPLTGKYGVYVSDIWRARCSTHNTLCVQNTEWNVLSPTRNEPPKYGPDEDHSIPEMMRNADHWKVWWRPLLFMKATHEFENRWTRQNYSQLEAFQQWHFKLN